jgi:hypothetical protein
MALKCPKQFWKEEWSGRNHTTNFKIYCTPQLSRLCHCQKDTQSDGAEKCLNLTYTIMVNCSWQRQRQFQWRKNNLFNKRTWNTIGCPYSKDSSNKKWTLN